MRFSETFRMQMSYSCIHALNLAMKRFVLNPVRSACDHVLAAAQIADGSFEV
jgi:hypothetical protein